MKSRAFLIVALLASTAWAQKPAAQAAAPAAHSLELRSDAVKKIVRDAAASQYGNPRISDETPVDAGPREVVYVPPEEPLEELPLPGHQPATQPPAPAPQPDGFLSSMFEFLIEEAIGIDESDEVMSSNEMLRCRIQKEQKSSPPGPDRCPAAY